MTNLNLKCPTTWVEGHQDTTEEETAQLPWEAQLNIEVDKLGTEARHEMTEKDLKEFNILPASKLMLFINGAPITRRHANKICNAWTTQRLRDNMTRRFSWTPGTADKIDWYLHGSTLKAYDFYNLNFSIKFIHERLPLNGIKFHQSTTDQCTCCKEKKETLGLGFYNVFSKSGSVPKSPRRPSGSIPETTSVSSPTHPQQPGDRWRAYPRRQSSRSVPIARFLSVRNTHHSSESKQKLGGNKSDTAYSHWTVTMLSEDIQRKYSVLTQRGSQSGLEQ
jgi:hypothetical protein